MCCHFSIATQIFQVLSSRKVNLIVFVTPQIHWCVCSVWYILSVADHSAEFNKIIYIHIQTRFSGVFGFVWSVLKHQDGDIHLVGFLLNFQSREIQIGFLLNFQSGDIQISKCRHLDFNVEIFRLDFYCIFKVDTFKLDFGFLLNYLLCFSADGAPTENLQTNIKVETVALLDFIEFD